MTKEVMNERISNTNNPIDFPKENKMKVYILICNDQIHSVFPTQEQAQAYIDDIELLYRWNIWKIIEKQMEIPELENGLLYICLRKGGQE